VTRQRVWRGRDYRWGDSRGRNWRGRVWIDLSLFKPNLISMHVHRATCSCSVELYKLWYTFADFYPNWNFHGVFSTYTYTAKLRWAGAGNRFLGSLKGLQIRALVATGHKTTNVPLILKIWEIIFCFWANCFMGHFEGYFEGASTFLTRKLSLAALGTI
jgi:hypothetical protein